MLNSVIEKVTACEIIDSRAQPTVEASITLNDGAYGRAAVPSGASSGYREARELRDNDPKRYDGAGVGWAVDNITRYITPHLEGRTWRQRDLDSSLISLDGTVNKENLGANAMLAVSLAFAHASARSYDRHLFEHFNDALSPESSFRFNHGLPRPMFNILNGGAHADSGLSFQEFMVVPVFQPFSRSLRCGVEIYNSLKILLKERGYLTSIGDEGGFAPNLESNEQALELLMEAGERAGYRPGEDFLLSLDIAANEIHQDGHYQHNGHYLTREDFVNALIDLSSRYPIYSIEDPLFEEDVEGFAWLNQATGDKILIVGDDYLVTNPELITNASRNDSAGGVIIKLNQIGTVTETLEALVATYQGNMVPIVSHRSGETEDVSIAHLAFGTAAPLVKFGAPARGERTAKYNELIRIEEVLKNSLSAPVSI